MSAKRFHYVMIGMVAVLALLIIAAVAIGNKLLEQQANKLADLRAQNQVVENQKISLAQAKKDVEQYAELNELAKAIVPHDKDQARTVRELNAIAQDSGINLVSVGFDQSTLGQAPAPNKPTQNAGSSSQPAAPKPKQAPITQAVPVEGIAGVYAVPINVVPAENQPIPYERFLGFLERLEKNRRTAHVTSISVTPQGGGDLVTFSFVINVYVKP